MLLYYLSQFEHEFGMYQVFDQCLRLSLHLIGSNSDPEFSLELDFEFDSGWDSTYDCELEKRNSNWTLREFGSAQFEFELAHIELGSGPFEFESGFEPGFECDFDFPIEFQINFKLYFRIVFQLIRIWIRIPNWT